MNRERKLRVCNCTAHVLHLKQALLQWFPIRLISFVTWFECGFTWLHWSVMFIVLHLFSHSCTVYRNISLVVQMCKCFYYYRTIGSVVYVLHLFVFFKLCSTFVCVNNCGESWVAMLCFELKGSCWCCVLDMMDPSLAHGAFVWHSIFTVLCLSLGIHTVPSMPVHSHYVQTTFKLRSLIERRRGFVVCWKLQN